MKGKLVLLIFGLSLCSTSAIAQGPFSGPSVDYEDQNVLAIEEQCICTCVGSLGVYREPRVFPDITTERRCARKEGDSCGFIGRELEDCELGPVPLPKDNSLIWLE